MLRAISLIVLVIGLLGSAVTAQEETGPTVRAIWTPDVLVIINTGDAGVDLSNLRLASLVGEIEAEGWQLTVDPDTGALYTLADVRPGSCLVAFRSNEEPDLPDTVRCARTIAEQPISFTDNVVWDIAQGGFSAFLGEEEVVECSIRRTSCTIPVQPANSAADDGAAAPAVIRAIWTPEILVVINTSGQDVDLTSLRLENDNAAITPENWELDFSNELNAAFELDTVRPGDCLLSYLGSVRPELPENVTCTNIMGRYILEEVEQVIWDVTMGGFTAYVNDVPVADCTTQRTSCDIQVTRLQIVSMYWTETSFVFANETDSAIDVETLEIASAAGGLAVADWDLDEAILEPGDCLLATTEDDASAPNDATCENITGELVVEEAAWSGNFVPLTSAVTGETCEAEAGSCSMTLAQAQEN